MGLREDYNDIKGVWSEISLLGKVLFGGSFVVTSLSVASIGDAVYKLRGFIVTAIEFYRTIAAPIADYVRELTRIILSQNQVDALVLLGLLVGTQYRAFVNLSSKWYVQLRTRDDIFLAFYGLVICTIGFYAIYTQHLYSVIFLAFSPILYPLTFAMFVVGEAYQRTGWLHDISRILPDEVKAHLEGDLELEELLSRWDEVTAQRNVEFEEWLSRLRNKPGELRAHLVDYQELEERVSRRLEAERDFEQFASKKMPEDDFFIWPRDVRGRVLRGTIKYTATYLLAVLLFVALVAGVSEGLTRSGP